MPPDTIEEQAEDGGDYISTLLSSDDTALMKVFGLTQQLEEIKEGLAKLKTLSGEKREEANKKLKRQMEPHIYAGELNWIYRETMREKDEISDVCSC